MGQAFSGENSEPHQLVYCRVFGHVGHGKGSDEAN